MKSKIDAFLEYLERERAFSENTISAYRNDLNQLASFLADPPAESGLGPVTDIDDLRDGHLYAFADHLSKRDYASSTVARKMAALKSFANYLHRSETTNELLGRELVVPRVKKARPRAISPDEVERLLDAPLAQQPARPEQIRDLAMLELLYASGLRVSELVSLNVDDVDFDNLTLRLRGKRGKDRQVPLPKRSVKALQTWLGDPRNAIANRGETSLFVNHRGNRLTRQGFWLILKSYANQVGIEEITPHTLRHSFAAHAVDRGMDLKELQRRLGHVSSVTTQVYQQMRKEQANGSGNVEGREVDYDDLTRVPAGVE
ncbi:MAG TPA: tyrosine-type recombinase/integrase [Thermomicrobiales bacterium]|nr:tyrosine-type recombinase/integrase [Thermomicrobiales bacterium]